MGVCFGNLVTMNSPAGAGAAPVSWRSVLWHEYTHVVTLGMTRNRMPRWLSEGISVYEEGLADRSWRGAIAPKDREMILGGMTQYLVTQSVPTEDPVQEHPVSCGRTGWKLQYKRPAHCQAALALFENLANPG